MIRKNKIFNKLLGKILLITPLILSTITYDVIEKDKELYDKVVSLSMIPTFMTLEYVSYLNNFFDKHIFNQDEVDKTKLNIKEINVKEINDILYKYNETYNIFNHNYEDYKDLINYNIISMFHNYYI